MIRQFSNDTALLLIDVQKGVNDLQHWGGPTGRRNNPQAEARMGEVLEAFRQATLPVIFTQHDSRQKVSPLKIGLPGGTFIDSLQPREGELIIWKDVNSSFVGTTLELELRRRGVTRLVVAGFFTNYCVETTVRMAGNMAFDTYLIHDACATTNQIGVDGTDHDPELIHNISVTSMNGEFCTAIDHGQAIGLVHGSNAQLNRIQRNE
ncbi:cysteine hydrolase [Paracidovorax avenae]|uniref:cysteine hydrolase family protein n=1 Tax=Paracidovorax avenae TaxID=80867 RepID=UPI000D176F80|nr:cysteine hydrolase family protein [Paracidovorax avenae]AVS69491.1 cysteine hydrolase [Paracidovorax avenae]